MLTEFKSRLIERFFRFLLSTVNFVLWCCYFVITHIKMMLTMRLKHVNHTVSQILHSLGDVQLFSDLFALERAFHSQVINISSFVNEISHAFSPDKVHCLVHRNTEVTFPVQIHVEDLKYVMKCILADTLSGLNESDFVRLKALVVGDSLEISIEIQSSEGEYAQCVSSVCHAYSSYSSSELHVIHVKDCIRQMEGYLTTTFDFDHQILKLILPIEVC